MKSSLRFPVLCGLLAAVALVGPSLVGCGGGTSVPTPALPSRFPARVPFLVVSAFPAGKSPLNGDVVTPAEAVAATEAAFLLADGAVFFGAQSGHAAGLIRAKELGMSTALVAWHGPVTTQAGVDANDAEFAAAMVLAQAGHVDVLLIGSETLLRNDLAPADLAARIDTAKAAAPPECLVGTSDTWSELLDPAHSAVLGAVEIIAATGYPFWQGVPIENAIAETHARWLALNAVAAGRPLMWTEQGWPSAGQSVGAAVPSAANMSKFFRDLRSWGAATGAVWGWHELIDQAWKVALEGQVGGAWGLSSQVGVLKPGIEDTLNGATNPDTWSPPPPPPVPTMSFTFVPPIGSFADLQGLALGVDPGGSYVQVFIRVGSLWYVKPTLASPMTSIGSTGAWSCDVTTGGSDSSANRFEAFVFPNTVSPTTAFGATSLPSALFSNALATAFVDR